MKKNIEIISLIYKSVDYLNFIYEELNNEYCKVDGWDIGVRIVANDANEQVLNRLKELNIKHSIYNDSNPDDYYLNRVYRCWNYAGESSEYDNICFVNSDMMFSKNWLSNLLFYHDGKNIPTSRLIESGKMPSGLYGVSYDCGKNPKELNRKLWEKVVDVASKEQTKNGGLYMPCIFQKETFIKTGKFPEGNIYKDGIGTCNGHPIQSGDDWYFKMLEKKFGMKHITVFNSLVYHIQEGEKDELTSQ